MEYLDSGRPLELNPYIVQIDKFVNSLQKLMNVFLKLDEPKMELTKEEMDELTQQLMQRVCGTCPGRQNCENKGWMMYQKYVPMILHMTQVYGAELNVETRRTLERECERAPKFLRAVLEEYQNVKKAQMWNWKLAKSREGCASQMDTFAQMVRRATRELDASIYEDEHLQRKLRTRLGKRGIRMMNVVFYVTKEGRQEIHLTLRTGKGQFVATKEVCQMVSECIGKPMVLEQQERPLIGAEYCTIVCMEGPQFYTLQGIARIGKDCATISGDSFSMQELPGGKKAMLLSDGMGTGDRAARESARVIETLEELLEAGFPTKTALQMLNTALVMGREEVCFSTLDMSVFDLYDGVGEFTKAGASVTFIKTGNQVERLHSTTLPLGVLHQLELETEVRELRSGDFVIMITDGVLDALPTGEQEEVLEKWIRDLEISNPKEMAHYILEKVLEETDGLPKDDMTVLVAGIWSLEK